MVTVEIPAHDINDNILPCVTRFMLDGRYKKKCKFSNKEIKDYISLISGLINNKIDNKYIVYRALNSISISSPVEETKFKHKNFLFCSTEEYFSKGFLEDTSHVYDKKCSNCYRERLDKKKSNKKKLYNILFEIELPISTEYAKIRPKIPEIILNPGDLYILDSKEEYYKEKSYIRIICEYRENLEYKIS